MAVSQIVSSCHADWLLHTRGLQVSQRVPCAHHPPCHRVGPVTRSSYPAQQPHQLLSTHPIAAGCLWTRVPSLLPSPGLATGRVWGCMCICVRGGFRGCRVYL